MSVSRLFLLCISLCLSASCAYHYHLPSQASAPRGNVPVTNRLSASLPTISVETLNREEPGTVVVLRTLNSHVPPLRVPIAWMCHRMPMGEHEGRIAVDIDFHAPMAGAYNILVGGTAPASGSQDAMIVGQWQVVASNAEDVACSVSIPTGVRIGVIVLSRWDLFCDSDGCGYRTINIDAQSSVRLMLNSAATPLRTEVVNGRYGYLVDRTGDPTIRGTTF